jgi:hypothetical protein
MRAERLSLARRRLTRGAQQSPRCPRPNRVIVALLLLVLATLLAGPVGFVVVGLLLLVFAIVTGTLHLVIELLMLPFRAIGALDRDRS